MKFFRFLYAFFASKKGRFLLGFVILCLLFYIHFDKNYIDEEKIRNAINFLKDKDNANTNFIRSDEKEEEFYKKVDATTGKPIERIEKKELTPEEFDEDVELNRMVNIFLIIAELNGIYNDRLKNNKIDYNRRIKDGDYIYYNTKMNVDKTAILRDIDPEAADKMEKINKKIKDEGVRFFMKLTTSEASYFNKFIGKKVGDTIYLNFDDMISDLDDESKEIINRGVDSEIASMRKQYGISFDFTDFEIEFEILDFIPDDFVKKHNLEAYSY